MKFNQSTGKRKPKKLPAYLTEEEFMRVLKATTSPHHRLAFILAFNSGLRISEVVNLKPSQVDINARRINIRDAKGGKDRVVPLPKGFPQSYLKYLPMPCGIRALQIAFKDALKNAKITKPDLHFHSLRHSFAVQCMERNIPLNNIQVLLGHEDISTTGIYLKINPQDALKNYEEMW